MFSKYIPNIPLVLHPLGIRPTILTLNMKENQVQIFFQTTFHRLRKRYKAFFDGTFCKRFYQGDLLFSEAFRNMKWETF